MEGPLIIIINIDYNRKYCFMNLIIIYNNNLKIEIIIYNNNLKLK